MPLLALLMLAAASTVCAQESQASIVTTYSSDVIKLLWWALGILATLVASIITGVSIWMLLKILEHDKQLTAMKTKCDIEHPED